MNSHLIEARRYQSAVISDKVKISNRLILNVIAIFAALISNLDISAKEFVVVIDPGHGGKDYGAIGSITNEKTINLNVGKKLRDKIKAEYPDVKVVMTRSTDVFIPLEDRAKIANDAKGDLFISVHVNSVDKRNKKRRSVAGSEVYTCGLHRTESNLAVAQRENSVICLEDDYTRKYQGFDPKSPESYIAFELNQSKHLDRSINFATKAQNELVSTAKRADIGVKQAGFWVLWATSMPAVLVELDFICNPTSERFMASANGVEKLSKSLFNAFDSYYKAVNNVSSVDSSAESEGQDGSSAAPQNNKKTKRQQSPSAEKSAATDTSNAQPEADAGAHGQIEYRVQILAVDRKLGASSSELKGIEAEYYYDRGMYKYTVGHFAGIEQANAELRKVKRKFPQAFVVALQDGKRIN